MENIEFYKNNGYYCFINNDNQQEGTIIFDTGKHGLESFKFISHLEDCDNLTEQEQENYLDFFDTKLDLILNAKNL